VQDPITKKWVEAKGTGLGGAQKNFDAGIDWDKNVLKIAGKDIDFVSLHWYTGATTQASNWKEIDNTGTLLKTQDELPKIMAGLLDLFQKYCGQNMQNMQLLVTEFGITPWIKVNDETVSALFAADAYTTLVEDGAANIDWAEIHKNGFLNEENKPGPVYFATQLVRQMANLNDKIVTASSSNSLLAVHASLRSDGKVGIMFINKDAKNNAAVKVTVTGVKLGTTGARFDFGKNNSATQYAVNKVDAADLGNSFTVNVPSYTITDLLIPIAQ
jgi:alpha-L-arabinofuranosidase